MRGLSFISEPPVVRKILEHLKRTGSEGARAPPPFDADRDALRRKQHPIRELSILG